MLERRRYPRIEKQLRIRVAEGPDRMAAQTVNLSCGGALCEVPHRISPMTKVVVALALPERLIQCTGVVVRCETLRRTDGAGRGLYRLALFFTEVARADHRAIAEYVLDSMLKPGRSRNPQR